MKIGNGKNTIPHPLRKSGKKAARKQQKHIEAELRQRRYNALSKGAKIELINSRPGKSARELSKLLKKEA